MGNAFRVRDRLECRLTKNGRVVRWAPVEVKQILSSNKYKVEFLETGRFCDDVPASELRRLDDHAERSIARDISVQKTQKAELEIAINRQQEEQRRRREEMTKHIEWGKFIKAANDLLSSYTGAMVNSQFNDRKFRLSETFGLLRAALDLDKVKTDIPRAKGKLDAEIREATRNLADKKQKLTKTKSAIQSLEKDLLRAKKQEVKHTRRMYKKMRNDAKKLNSRTHKSNLARNEVTKFNNKVNSTNNEIIEDKYAKWRSNPIAGFFTGKTGGVLNHRQRLGLHGDPAEVYLKEHIKLNRIDDKKSKPKWFQKGTKCMVTDIKRQLFQCPKATITIGGEKFEVKATKLLSPNEWSRVGSDEYRQRLEHAATSPVCQKCGGDGKVCKKSGKRKADCKWCWCKLKACNACNK